MSKRKIGFIGLGTMGKEMANHVLSAGYPVIVWNRTKEKAQELVAKGAKLAAGPSEVAAEADIILTMLSADQQVKEVLLGKGGVIENVAEGKIVIDSSTVSPQTSRELFKAFAEKGVDFLDAPVTGSAPQAKAAKLGFMVGGKKEIFEQCEELFLTMGHAAVHLGDSGAGSVAKLANNTMAAISLLALTEGLAIAQKGGVNPYDFVKIVSSGGAHSKMVENKHVKMIEGDMTAQFAAKLMNKDLGLALQMCHDLGVVTPVLAVAKQLLGMTVGKGFGDEDVVAVHRLYQEWSGQNW